MCAHPGYLYAQTYLFRECDEQIRREQNHIPADGAGNPDHAREFFTYFGLEVEAYDEDLFQVG